MIENLTKTYKEYLSEAKEDVIDAIRVPFRNTTAKSTLKLQISNLEVEIDEDEEQLISEVYSLHVDWINVSRIINRLEENRKTLEILNQLLAKLF